MEHTHTYIRWKKTLKGIIFKCADSSCYHTAFASLINGKKTICPICRNKEFVLTAKDLQRAKPRCPACSQTRESKTRRRLKELLEPLISPTVEIEDKTSHATSTKETEATKESCYDSYNNTDL